MVFNIYRLILRGWDWLENLYYGKFDVHRFVPIKHTIHWGLCGYILYVQLITANIHNII